MLVIGVIEEEVNSVEDVTLAEVVTEEERDGVSWEDEVWLDVVEGVETFASGGT